MKFSQPLRILGALCVLQPGVHAFAADRTSPAEQMLNFFGSTCIASDGSFTKASLDKALTLAETLEGVKNDADCQALSTASTQASAISDSLAILKAKNNNNQSFVSQQQAILSVMAYTTDPEMQSSMQDLLVKVSVNQKLSDYEVQALAAKQMVLQTNNLVQQAINNQNCLMKKPNILAGIGSLVSAVGVAATAINPAIGLGAAAGGNMMSNLVNLISQAKLAKQIRKLKDDTLMPEAVSCVMESLTTDFCKASDALKALEWKEKHKHIAEYPISSAAYAMRLVDREIPALVKWLTELRTATKSQNIYDASQVSDFKAREALYQSSPSLASGVITSTYMNPADPADIKWSVLKRAVNMMVGVLWGSDNNYGNNSSSKNPLFQVYSEQQALYYLIGFSPAYLPKNSVGDVISFNQYNPNSQNAPQPPGGISYDLKLVSDRFDTWFAATANLVNAERNRVQKLDPQKILQSAFKGEQTEERVSVSEAINNLILFFDNQRLTNLNDSESLFLLPDTLARLQSIKNELDGTHASTWINTKENASTSLGNIYKFAELGDGVVFMADRLRFHADSALIRYLGHNPAPADQSILAQTLASDKMTEILMQTNPGKKLGEVSEDISNSLGITLKTYDDFINNYQYVIRDVLENFLANEQNYGPYVGKTWAEKRGRVCLMLAQAVEWPSSIPFSLCEGTSYGQLLNGPHSAPLTRNLIDLPMEQRICKLYNVRRDTVIYETRDIFH